MSEQNHLENTKPRMIFERRQLLKVFASLPAAALAAKRARAAQNGGAAPAAAQAMNDAANIAGGYQRKILTEHEYNAVRVLSDWIIPADERSGSASEAGVPEFIDDWLDDQRGELLGTIRGGLTWLDVQSNRSFGRDFVDSNRDQQKQILDRIAFPQQASAADQPGAHFFDSLRDLVVSGFYTSEIGLRDLPYLGNEPQASWQGCPAPVMAKLKVMR